MVLKRIERRVERHIRRMYLVDQVQVIRLLPDGTEEVGEPVPAMVQNVSVTSGQMQADITDANADSRGLAWCWMQQGTVVEPSNRVLYNGQRWEALLITPEVTAAPYRRVLMGREQIGTVVVEVTFYRRRNGTTTTVGTYPVQMTRREAADNTVTGVMVGGSELTNVVVGDWFAIDEIPGQITSIDTTAEGRVELNYRQQVLLP